ncbi:MAG: hypothetical protein RLZZ316_477 [Bacteroidota bacterium]|jgi:hypothetical protein
MIKKRLLICCLLAQTILGGFLFTACGSSKEAATPGVFNNPALQEAITTNEWLYTANDLQPQSGRSRPVNGIYTVQAIGQKMVVSLPYIGRSFSAAAAYNNQNPLNFETTNYEITKTQNKKGVWLVTIKPIDYKEVQSMVFMFYDNGTARLNITLTNRSPINYNGRFEVKKK